MAPWWHQGRSPVTATATALRLERQALFELLADHTDLLQGLFSFLLRLER